MKKLILITFAVLFCLFANSQSYSATGDLEITGSLKVTGDFSSDFESHFYRRADFDSLYVNGYPVSHYLIETDSTVYVSETGGDITGDGTELNPFATIERATVNFTNRYIITGTNATIQVDTGNYILSQIAKDNLATITLEDVTSELYILGSYDLIASVTLSATSDPFIYDVLVGGVAPTWPVDTFEFEFLQRSTDLKSGSTPISWNSSNQLETMPDMSSGSIQTLRTTINLEGDLNRLSVNNRTATTNLKYQNFIFGYCKFTSTNHIDLNNEMTFHQCLFKPAATKLVRCNVPIYFQGNAFDCGVLLTSKPYNFHTSYVNSNYADGALRFQESGICRGLILEGDGSNVGVQIRNGNVASNNATGARIGTKIKNVDIAFQLSDGKFSSGPDADQVIIENSNYFMDVLGYPSEIDLGGLMSSSPTIQYVKGYDYNIDVPKNIRLNATGVPAFQDTVFAHVVKFEDETYQSTASQPLSGEEGDILIYNSEKLVPSDSLLSGSYFNWTPPYLYINTNYDNYLDINFSNVDNSSFFNYNFIFELDEIYFNQDISALDIYADGVSPYSLYLDEDGLTTHSGITVGNSTNEVTGTIRHNGYNFEGYNGSEWQRVGNYDTVINISCPQILSGVDSLPVLPYPGTGKCYNIIKVAFYYDFITTAYTGGGTSYLRTLSQGISTNLYSFGNSSIFNATSDYVYYESATGDEKIVRSNARSSDINVPVWFYLPSFSTGNSVGKLYVKYAIMDFN